MTAARHAAAPQQILVTIPWHRLLTPVVWLTHHVYGTVITLVAMTFVSGLAVSLALDHAPVAGILVAMVGVPVITATIAYRAGGA